MEKAAYDYIKKYCSDRYGHFMTQHEKDYVYRQFIESYIAAIDKYKEENQGKEPDGVQKTTIMNSLLNDNTLHSYADSSKSYFEHITTNIETEYAKKMGRASFWKNVGASILANLIYSISLIIVFWVAHDQIVSWLSQLLQGGAT